MRDLSTLERTALERTLKAQTRCDDATASGSAAIVCGAVEEPPLPPQGRGEGIAHCGKSCPNRRFRDTFGFARVTTLRAIDEGVMASGITALGISFAFALDAIIRRTYRNVLVYMK